MAGIFETLANLFTSSGKVVLNGVTPDKVTDGSSNSNASAQVSAMTSIPATTTTSQKFPQKLFNIEIDKDFPPAEANILLPKKSVSEVCFFNDYIEPEDIDLDLNYENNNELFSDDETPEIAQIIQIGMRDFQAKYLEKIEAAFHVQLEHVTTIFRNGLEKAHNAIERQLDEELGTIRNDHKNRIAEFEASTIYYRDATVDVLEENRIQRDGINKKIQNINDRVLETAARLKTELEQKLVAAEQGLREERAQVKLDFHENVMAAGNIMTNGRWVLEEKLKFEVNKQEKIVETLQTENEELEGKVNIAEIHAMVEFNRREQMRFMREREYHQALIQKRSLEKKVDILQKQNTDLLEAYKAQMKQMTQLNDIREEHYNSECSYFRRLLQETRATFQEDIGHFKESTKLQEEAREAAIESLHDAYRFKLVDLLETVQELKATTERLWGPNSANPNSDTAAEIKFLHLMPTTAELTAQLQQLRAEVSKISFQQLLDEN